MKTLALIILAACAAIAISSCDNEDGDGKDCRLELSYTAPADGFVRYTVSLNYGSGGARSITYHGNAQDVTVNSPSLPWEFTVAKEKGDPLSLTTMVYVKGGALRAEFYYVTLGGEALSISQECVD